MLAMAIRTAPEQALRETSVDALKPTTTGESPMKRLSILAGLLVAMLLASVVPAEANAPRQVNREDDIALTLHCDGFRLVDEAQVFVHIQRFFGSDGRWSHITVHLDWNGVITKNVIK